MIFNRTGFTPEDATTFRTARPFPHIILDGLFDDLLIDAAAASFPPPEDPRWVTYPDPKEYGKRCLSDRTQIGPPALELISELLDAGTSAQLTDLTGIPDLSPDLLGGGLHLSTTDARLAVHRDFNRNGALARRLNLLVFLSDQPEDEPGGTLYLGERTQNSHVSRAVAPRRNRTVIFECGPDSWHGHPIPISSGWQRKSIAVYYYSPIPADWPEAHSTVWES